MCNPQEYAERRATNFQEALRRTGYPTACVTHDWNHNSFYRFTVELNVETVLRVKFDAQDIAMMGTSDEKWLSAFVKRLRMR